VNVAFDSGSSELDTNARGALNGVATWMKMRSGRTIKLVGSSDKKGGATGNKRLSERRAAAVKDYLLGQGIEPERITTAGLGEEAGAQRASGRSVVVIGCDVAGPDVAAPPPEAAVPEAAVPPPALVPPPVPAPLAPAPPPARATLPPPVTPPPAAATVPPPAPALVPPPPPAMPTQAPVPGPVPPPPAVVPSPPRAVVPVPPPPPPRFAPPPLSPALVPLQPPPSPAANTYHPPSVLGIEATLGGGVIGFADVDTRSLTNTGGEWEARMTFGSRVPIAVEAAYVGSAQGMTALGVGTNSVLVGNGVEGTLRVNLSTSRAQPYIFGGGGFTHYQVTNTTPAFSSLRVGDNVGTVPTGVGLSARLAGAFLADVRGTYRFAFNGTLFDTTTADLGIGNARLDTWSVTGRIGFEF
jgi:hypothetical protein